MEIGIGVPFSLSENDKKVLKYWKDNDIYKDWINYLENINTFNFVDGPPFVSSENLHYGHILISLIKSTVLYYQRMNGSKVTNKIGYDVHGLPIEMVVNKILEVNTRRDVLDMGIDKYNEKCREIITKYSGQWTPVFDSIGRLTSEDHYKTMDTPFMESTWWVFKQLYEKGLVYKGIRVLPYSPACNTPLSNFEAGQNYKDVEDTSIYVGFRLLSNINSVSDIYLQNKDIYIVAWTTTPWTLPANMALCVNAGEKYVLIESKKLDKILLLAENNVKKLFPDYTHDNIQYNILEIIFGSELVDLEYEPLYSSCEGHVYKILEDEFVQCFPYEKDKSPGSGVVHLAPGFGEDDYRVCKRVGIIEPYVPVDENGYYKFDDNILEINNKFYKDVNKDVINDLKERELLIKREQYKHSYPFCWRTDTPLIYKAIDAWFVETTKIRDQLLENNKKINWYPSNIGTGRFQNWLENTKDWCISRNRFFGTPIPIWINENDKNDIIVVGSIEELYNLSGIKVDDLHIEYVDKIVIERDGNKYYRVSEVMDCWFESGSVPYAQIHYPFENSKYFDNDKDALCDFICEGIDQTRGWFYTLHVISTALFNKPAFKNVMCAGLILASDGKKISKRLNNFIPPQQVIEDNGADALRLYMLHLPATYGDSSRFKEEDIKKQTKSIIQWINSVKFLIEHVKMYENYENCKLKWLEKLEYKNELDLWIISRKNTIIKSIKKYMETYEVTKVIDLIYTFIEDYTNWYLKFNRHRLKGKYGVQEWIESLSVCIEVTNDFNLCITPFTPFLSESIHTNLCNNNISKYKSKSILLEKYLDDDKLEYVNESSERKFRIFQQVCEAIRALRFEVNLGSVKIPLKKVTLKTKNREILEDLESVSKYFYSDEINIIELDIKINDDVKYYYTMDAKYGKIYKSDFKNIKDKLLNLSNIEYNSRESCIKVLDFDIPKEYINENIKSTYILEEYEVMKELENITIIVDKTQDENVYERHFIRMLIYHTQKIRKASGIRPWDKILFVYNGSNLNNILSKYKNELEKELGYSIDYDKILDKDYWIRDDIEIDEKNVELTIYKL